MRGRIVFCCAAATSVVAFVVLKNVDCRGLASALCERISTDPAIKPDLARDAFATTPVDPVVLTPGHTHADAAALRTSSTNFARKMACYVGTNLFVLGLSKSDQRKGLKGTRQWYWAKDTHIENRSDEEGRADLRYICDVDYYMDMPEVLASDPRPVLLYTSVPEEAASHGKDDTSTYFDSEGRLVTLVAGGGTYHHHIWDYGADSLIATKTWFGIPVRIATFAIERKQVGYGRQIILLSPIRVFGGLAACIAHLLLQGPRLERFDPIETAIDGKKYVRFRVHTKSGTQVTTGTPGSLLAATIPAYLDDAIATVARLGTTNLMLPTVASWLEKDQRASAAVLTEYHRSSSPSKMPMVYPVDRSVRGYQYEPRQFNPEARPKIQGFMSPLVHAAFAPVANDAGERRCVKGRIEDLRKPEPGPHAFRDQCLGEFVEFVTDGVVLEPVCYETVELKQTSAAQKLSLRKATLAGPMVSKILKCFIKAECYTDVKDPRNISTYNDSDKLEMGQYALALAAHMKQFPWYGPGLTPREIAERVVEICRQAEFVNVSDYHRMDGTISYWLRLVDRGVCMKAFANHRAALNELLKRNAGNVGVMPFGTRFDQGPSHGSGCSATSLFQTLRAAFTAYLGFRHTITHSGDRMSPRKAFESIGIHVGDDGLDADLPTQDHKWAADRVGLVLEAAVVWRGEPGVNFLARYYSPEVWYGSLNSMCDVKRQLSKFHTTVRLPSNVTPEQKLVEKAMSYVATDANTPVIGEYCKRVLTISKYRPKTPLGIGNWWSRFEASVQYPNENVGGWMDVEFTRLFPQFDRNIFVVWMASAQQIKTLLEAPLCAEPIPPTPTKVDIVVDETVIEAKVEEPKDQGQIPSKAVKATKLKVVRKRIKSPSDKSKKNK